MRDQDVDALAKEGLMERGADGTPRQTSAGRAVMAAAKRGDAQAANEAYSRGRDAVAKQGEQAAKRQDAAGKRATAQVGLTYYFYPSRSTSLSVGFIGSSSAGSTWGAPTTVASGMPSTWVATTSQGRMVGDYISTSFGSDNVAHGVFATASAPTSGTSCSQVLDNCSEPTNTFGGSASGGSASGAGSAVLFGGNGTTGASSLWNVVDNNGSKHRD